MGDNRESQVLDTRAAKASSTSGKERTAFLNDSLDELAELDSLWCDDCHKKFGRMAYEGKIVDGCRNCWEQKGFVGHPPQNFCPYVKAQMLARKAQKAALAARAAAEDEGLSLPPTEPRAPRRNSKAMLQRRQSLPAAMPVRLDEAPPAAKEVPRGLAELHAIAAERKAERERGAVQATVQPTQEGSGNSSSIKTVPRRGLGVSSPSDIGRNRTALGRHTSLPEINKQEGFWIGDVDGIRGFWAPSSKASDQRRPSSGGDVHRKDRPSSGTRQTTELQESRGREHLPKLSAHMRVALDNLVRQLRAEKLISEKALGSRVTVDGEGFASRMDLARELRGCGVTLAFSELDGLLRSFAYNGSDINFPNFCNAISLHAKSLPPDEADKRELVAGGFEVGGRVRSLIVLSWRDSQYEKEEGVVEGPGPTSGTIAVRFDLINEIMYMKPSQLARVSGPGGKAMVRRKSVCASDFSSNRRRTL